MDDQGTGVAYADPVAEVPLDMPRIWVEFTDPEDADQRFRCDLTWLTSNWMCIYGNGCQGIYADRPDDGCCTLGAHFTEDDDYEAGLASPSRNSPGRTSGSTATSPTEEGVLRKDSWTEPEDGATKDQGRRRCLHFLNRAGLPQRDGLRAAPARASCPGSTADVAPQARGLLAAADPARYRTVELARQQTSYLEVTITEYDRRGWGPGGHDLDWYCSGNPEAHVGREPVYRSNQVELVELMGRGRLRGARRALRGPPARRHGGSPDRQPQAAAVAGPPGDPGRAGRAERRARVGGEGPEARGRSAVPGQAREEAPSPVTGPSAIPSPNIS